jgi:hypothetical protein
MGFSRDTYIEGIQARISAELDAAEAARGVVRRKLNLI